MRFTNSISKDLRQHWVYVEQKWVSYTFFWLKYRMIMTNSTCRKFSMIVQESAVLRRTVYGNIARQPEQKSLSDKIQNVYKCLS